MLYLIDTYAWIEYFIGLKKGEVLKKLFLNEKNQFLTLECCLAELHGWCLRNNQNFDVLLKIVRANSSIKQVKEDDWIKSAKERFEQRKFQKDFGLIDAIILTKQKELNCKLISGDKHFKDLKNIIFIG